MNRLMAMLDRIDWSRWEGPIKSGIRIVLILILAWAAIAVLQRLVRAVRIRITARMGGVESVKRAETLGRVTRYLIALVVGVIAFMLVLAEVGISLAPILGAAGVVGVAVGFGAQSLVKDYFAGFFLLLEDQIRTGDVVDIAGISGLVEDLTLRHVRLRDYDGHVHFVPNGLITTVTNKARGFAYSVMDIGVAYRENADDCLAVMAEVAAQLRDDAPFKDLILDPFEVVGVERWDDSAVILRGRFRVAPLAQWMVRREYLRRLKAVFDEKNIEIPFPHVTLYPGVDRKGMGPSLQVAIAATDSKAAIPGAT
ncbi:MAG: mechanosensitive ion channel family protein [Burkholderiaceae bacterium]